MASESPPPPVEGSTSTQSASAPDPENPTVALTGDADADAEVDGDAELVWAEATIHDNSEWPAAESAPAFSSTSDGYSSADEEGPRRKKARRRARTPNPAPAPTSSVSDDEDDGDDDSNVDVTKPDTDFNFDEQLFNNMFASADTIAHEYEPGAPRPIVVDGSNIAFSHGNNKHFSEQGILICIDYFQQRGHDVKVFVSRCQHVHFTRKIAKDLETRQLLVFTPSRMVNGKRITAYDDRFILQYATVKKGIVVTNDNYRDLYDEDEKYHEVIRERLLQFSWPENDILMFPIDPLGRNGPRLDEFLNFPTVKNKEKTKIVTTTTTATGTTEPTPGTSQPQSARPGLSGLEQMVHEDEEGEAEASSGYESSGSAGNDSGSDYESDDDL